MKIGIDCRLSGLTHAGIGRYIENLISRLPDLAPQIEWIFFYNTPDQILPILKKKKNITWVYTPIRHYTLAEQIQLKNIFEAQNLDLLHVPHFNIPIRYSGKLIVTIHDLLWHEQRGSHVTTLAPWKYWLKYLGYKLVTAQAVKKATSILVPTQTIKKTLNTYYPDISSKVTVTYEGIDSSLLKFKNKKIKKHEKQSQSLIYVGSLYPHKNLNLVIHALRQLPAWHLTIVGSRNVFQDQIRELTKKVSVQTQVTFAGYLPDKELALEIKRSTALVQPSFSEGFGLTGLEALALGTPVLVSDIPVFKEIYENHAIYFDPFSIEDFINSLPKIEKQKVTPEDIKKLTNKYSWDTMSKQTLEEYKQVVL